MELETYLPYLVNRVGQRFVAAFSPVLAAAGVDVQMWRVLSVLHAKGEQSAGSLAALTSINPSTLSRLLGRMSEIGLVERCRGDADGRAVAISLTGNGRSLTESLLPEATQLETAAARHLTEYELDTLKTLLTRLYDDMAAEHEAVES